MKAVRLKIQTLVTELNISKKNHFPHETGRSLVQLKRHYEYLLKSNHSGRTCHQLSPVSLSYSWSYQIQGNKGETAYCNNDYKQTKINWWERWNADPLHVASQLYSAVDCILSLSKYQWSCKDLIESMFWLLTENLALDQIAAASIESNSVLLLSFFFSFL